MPKAMGRPEGVVIEAGVGPLGRAIVAACKRRGCGVRTLAAELGVQPACLYRWIHGMQPRAAQLAALYAACPELNPPTAAAPGPAKGRGMKPARTGGRGR